MSTFTVDEALALRAPADLHLADIDPASTPGLKHGDSDKSLTKDLEKSLDAVADELKELQEKLYAHHRAGDKVGNVLIVLQGMDTSGKGGAVKELYRLLDPQGIQRAAFGAPTEEEKQHDFLWRIRKQLPAPGMVGVFDRSHYEDVLIHRVEGLSTPEVIEQRYEAIRAFEAELASNGTRVLKFMLHISPEFQKENLVERLEDPAKYWKYNPGDIDAREKWGAYQEAYERAIRETTCDDAPWFVVPSDNKPYARLAIALVLLDTLRGMHLEWPRAKFDVDAELKRVKAMAKDPRDSREGLD